MFQRISSSIRNVFSSWKEESSKGSFGEADIFKSIPATDLFSHPDEKSEFEEEIAKACLATEDDLNQFKFEAYSAWSMVEAKHDLRLMSVGVNIVDRSRTFVKVAGVSYAKLMVNLGAYINEEKDGDVGGVWWPSESLEEYQLVEETSFSAVLVKIIAQGTAIEITYRGSAKSVSSFEEEVLSTWLKLKFLGPQPITVKWMYKTEMGIGRLKQPLTVPEEIKGAYPWIKGSIQEFADRFMNSDANILLLQGPRGTGKTTFLKQLIKACNVQARITYDGSILSSDGLFIEFIQDRHPGLLVIEDNDELLKARSEGNQAMARLLNVGDGIISFKGKKMVFTTNLDSLDSVDSALLRPGRCFSVLEFRNLSTEEAKVVTDGLYVGEVSLPENTGEGYSLAYLTNCVTNEKKPSEVKVQSLTVTDTGSSLSDYDD